MNLAILPPKFVTVVVGQQSNMTDTPDVSQIYWHRICTSNNEKGDFKANSS